MVKLIRVTQQIFGLNGNAAHFEQFGAKALTGSPVPTLDPASIMASSAFTGDGWLDAVVNANKQPFLEDMNGLFRVAFYQLGQIFQDGIPVWDSGTTYFTGSIARQDGTSNLFASAIDNNTGNALPTGGASNGFWTFLNPASIPSGTMLDFAGTAAPTGYLFCDGSVYAQGTYPALFAAIGTNWNTGGEGAGNFRVPNMAGFVAVGKGGTVGLSVGGTTGEATHVLTTPEMPVHNHSATPDSTVFAGDAPNGGPQTGYGTNGIGQVNQYGQTGGVLTKKTIPAQAIGNTGGGAPHNNVQPSAGVTKIIKF